jgi:hypothetical protein
MGRQMRPRTRRSSTLINSTLVDTARADGDAHATEDQSAWGSPPPDQVSAHQPVLEVPVGARRTADVTETQDVTFSG